MGKIRGRIKIKKRLTQLTFDFFEKKSIKVRRKTKTTEQFIAEAKAVHGDRYDYSESEYVNSYTKIKIICPEHGSFEQVPYGHLRGQGCPKCGRKKNIKSQTKTAEQFIAEAKSVHGDRYDYSDSEYVNCETKVKIICPEHGSFEQRPRIHLNGSGCPKCGLKKFIKSQTKTTEQFIAEAKAVHGDRYGYSESEYVNCKTKVKIICPEHGSFEQAPHIHLGGQGCPKCSHKERAKSQTKTTEQFIAEAKSVHGDRYDYSDSEYVNCETKVKIICPEHGSFEQSPHNHLQGRGCPTCKSSKGELSIQSILESLSIKYEREKRFKSCKNKFSLPFDFFLPDLNILIEYDGEHHFRPVTFGGNKAQAQENFKLRQKTDKIKTCWAKSSPYTLHRIKHDQDIEKKMKEIIA